MDRVPKSLLDGVVRVFDPVQVILFGSRARGDHRPDSDIDLYVIVDDDTPPERVTSRNIGEARRDCDEAVDILVRRSSDFEKRSRWLNVVERDVADEGVVVYARA